MKLQCLTKSKITEFEILIINKSNYLQCGIKLLIKASSLVVKWKEKSREVRGHLGRGTKGTKPSKAFSEVIDGSWH